MTTPPRASRKTQLSLVACALLAFEACVIRIPRDAAAPVALTAEGSAVQVSKADPPPGYEEVGPVSVGHGEGCGSMGKAGSYEGAYALLRNEAGKRGAHYVRLDVAVPPHSEQGCVVNTYLMQGIAFRRK